MRESITTMSKEHAGSPMDNYSANLKSVGEMQSSPLPLVSAIVSVEKSELDSPLRFMPKGPVHRLGKQTHNI
jgi:hypothetical protein